MRSQLHWAVWDPVSAGRSTGVFCLPATPGDELSCLLASREGGEYFRCVLISIHVKPAARAAEGELCEIELLVSFFEEAAG